MNLKFNTSKVLMPKMNANYEKSPEVFLKVLEERLKVENINNPLENLSLCCS